MVIRKKKCRDCGNAITHNTVCCPYCGSVDPFGYYRNTDRIVTILLALIIVVLLTTVSFSVRRFGREAAVKCAAFQILIEPFLHAHHGSNLFLQQVKTIAAPTQTVPWVRDVGVRMVHTVKRLRLYGGAGTCQSYLQDV